MQLLSKHRPIKVQCLPNTLHKRPLNPTTSLTHLVCSELDARVISLSKKAWSLSVGLIMTGFQLWNSGGAGKGLESANKFSRQRGWETRLATYAFCQNIPALHKVTRNHTHPGCLSTPDLDTVQHNKATGSFKPLPFCFTRPTRPSPNRALFPPQASDIYSSRGGAFPGKHSVFQVSTEHPRL